MSSIGYHSRPIDRVKRCSVSTRVYTYRFHQRTVDSPSWHPAAQTRNHVSARVHAILSTRYLRTKDRRDTFIIAVSSSTSDSVDRIGNDNEKVKRQFVMVILLAVNLTSVCHVVVFG